MTNNCRSRAFVLMVAAAAASVSACGAGRRPPGGATTRGSGAASEPIARVGDLVITVADVQNRINAQPPVVRSQYGSLDKKKQLVTDLVNFELMAAEAVRRGYDRDPDVIRMMKQQMIGKLVQKDLEAKVKADDVSAADIERYYDEHARDFSRPEQRPLTDVTAQIRQQLIQAARTKAVTDFVAGLRAQHPVAIDERNLAKVAIDTTVSSNQRIAIDPRRRRGPVQ
jgi:hypothetical protein